MRLRLLKPLARLAFVLLLAVALAAPASAQTPPVATIDGSPLNVSADGLGRVQARFDGAAGGEFSPPASDPANAGFNLAFYVPLDTSATVYGFLGTDFGRISGPTKSGAGTDADPFRIRSRYGTSSFPPLEVAEDVRYVDGASAFAARYDVTNNATSDPAYFRPSVAADLYVAGDGVGTGLFDAGPPRRVGGVNHEVGSSGAIGECDMAAAPCTVASPWSKHEANHYTTVFDKVRAPLGPGFDGTIVADAVDNGAGVQWDGYDRSSKGLPPGGVASFEVVWRFTRFDALTLDPQSAARTVGETHVVMAAARDVEGRPFAGRTVRYAIEGANPGAGAATTGDDGLAAIAWKGASAGTDLLTAHLDLNGDGARQANEPKRTASVDWTSGGPPPPLRRPRFAETFNLELVRGRVLLRLARKVGARAFAGQKGVGRPIRLTALGRQVPVGTRVDTSRGEVKLTVATTPKGARTEAGNFFDGIFTVLQRRARGRRRAQATADMVLKGSDFRAACGSEPKGRRSARPKGRASARRRRSVRRLWGNGRGRFRTRGRYSSATVRGTLWLTEDRCDGTLTRVRTGRVQVRDFVRRRTIAVLAGKSYLALARRPR